MILTTAELAALIGVSTTRVSQLEKAQVVVKLSFGKYDGPKSVQGYLAYKLTEQSGAYEKLDESDFEKHRARLYRAKADREERKSQLEAGKVLDSDAMGFVWNEMVSKAKGKFLAFPAKLSPRMILREDVVEVREELRTECIEVLGELHEFDAKPIIERWLAESGAQGGEPDEDGVESSAESDG